VDRKEADALQIVRVTQRRLHEAVEHLKVI
jgi:hypothetical protein